MYAMQFNASELGHSIDISITKTCLYNFDPLKHHFYVVKLEFTGVYIIFLISAQKHRYLVLGEAVLTNTNNLCFRNVVMKIIFFLILTLLIKF